jgi:hypothetical protein
MKLTDEILTLVQNAHTNLVDAFNLISELNDANLDDDVLPEVQALANALSELEAILHTEEITLWT